MSHTELEKTVRITEAKPDTARFQALCIMHETECLRLVSNGTSGGPIKYLKLYGKQSKFGAKLLQVFHILHASLTSSFVSCCLFGDEVVSD